MKYKLLSLSLIGAFVGIATQGYAQMYTVTDLGTLGGYSFGTGVNDSGQVVGYSTDSLNYYHAFLYENSTMINIGGTSGSSFAEGINSLGQVTGEDSSNHAFIYNAGGMTDLGTLGGTESEGLGINGSGEVTGESQTTGNANTNAFLFNGSSMVDIAPLLNRSIGSSINSTGEVAGYYTGNSGNDRAFLYNGTTSSDIGTLGGLSSIAFGINDSGMVVGQSSLTGNSAAHAFCYNGSKMTDLGTLGGTESIAYSINNSGQIVGNSETSNSVAPFLYSNGQMINLNSLIASNSGWQIRSAISISNNGNITGMGSLNGGADHAFLLTPQAVPEPRMAGTVLIGLGFFFFKKRR